MSGFGAFILVLILLIIQFLAFVWVSHTHSSALGSLCCPCLCCHTWIIACVHVYAHSRKYILSMIVEHVLGLHLRSHVCLKPHMQAGQLQWQGRCS